MDAAELFTNKPNGIFVGSFGGLASDVTILTLRFYLGSVPLVR